MNLKLTIEGSASQLAMILANLPDGVAVNAAPPSPAPAPVAPPMPAPVAQPAPIPPMPAAPTGGDGDDDENGPVAAVADGAVDSNGLPWDERIHAKTKATNADGSWRYRRGVDDATKTAVEAELRARSAPPMPAPVAQPAPIPPMPANPEGGVAPAIPTAPVAMPAVPMQPMAPPPPLAAAPIPPAMPAPADMAHGAVAAAPVANPAPVAPPMPAPVAQPAPAPVMPTADQVNTAVAATTGTMDFAQFMQHLSGQMAKRDANGAPLVHADYLAGITAEIGQAFQQQLTAITDIAANPQMITYAMQLMQRDGRW